MSEASRTLISEFISSDYLTWHALPFTMFNELADEGLIESALLLSDELDRRFGKKKKRVAVMEDVPGPS